MEGDFNTQRVTESSDLPLLQQVSQYELAGYMRNTLLRDSDVFSMAHGLELRVPFVDQGVAAAAFAVDDQLKLARGSSKPLLLSAVRDLLPREVWDRPKQGFTLPFAHWLHNSLRPEVSSAFAVERLRRVGLSASATHDVWNAFLRGRGISWSRPWALYTLVQWAERNEASLDADSSVDAPMPSLLAG
jgi:asparagine synthase (glutamine-hydrolysing)